MKSIYFSSLICFFLLSSCGKSPFLTESSNTVNKGDDLATSEYTQSIDVSLKKPNGDGRNEESSFYLVSKKVKFRSFWSVSPLEGRESKLFFSLHNEDGDLVKIENTLNVFLWMPGMGHGSSPVEIEKKMNGIYEISNMYFIMPGFWEVHIQFITNDKIQSEIIWPINI